MTDNTWQCIHGKPPSRVTWYDVTAKIISRLILTTIKLKRWTRPTLRGSVPSSSENKCLAFFSPQWIQDRQYPSLQHLMSSRRNKNVPVHWQIVHSSQRKRHEWVWGSHKSHIHTSGSSLWSLILSIFWRRWINHGFTSERKLQGRIQLRWAWDFF